jgi:hypothetical protein
MSTAPADRGPHSGWYLIRIEGRLPSRWASHFEPMTLTDPGDGTTLIEGPVVDQAARHGLLQQVRDTGLSLISVTRPRPDQFAATAPINPRSARTPHPRRQT